MALQNSNTDKEGKRSTIVRIKPYPAEVIDALLKKIKPLNRIIFLRFNFPNAKTLKQIDDQRNAHDVEDIRLTLLVLKKSDQRPRVDHAQATAQQKWLTDSYAIKEHQAGQSHQKNHRNIPDAREPTMRTDAMAQRRAGT